MLLLLSVGVETHKYLWRTCIHAMPQKNEKVRLGIVEWSKTHVHFVLPPGVETPEREEELCFILQPGANYICTAPPTNWGDADFYKSFNTIEDMMKYIDNFARRVEKAREKGLLPASWRWIQRHIRP